MKRACHVAFEVMVRGKENSLITTGDMLMKEMLRRQNEANKIRVLKEMLSSSTKHTAHKDSR